MATGREGEDGRDERLGVLALHASMLPDLRQRPRAFDGSLDGVQLRAEADGPHAAHDTISDPDVHACEYGHVLHAHPRTG